jgi:hypothetical protein
MSGITKFGSNLLLIWEQFLNCLRHCHFQWLPASAASRNLPLKHNVSRTTVHSLALMSIEAEETNAIEIDAVIRKLALQKFRLVIYRHIACSQLLLSV